MWVMCECVCVGGMCEGMYGHVSIGYMYVCVMCV